MKKLWLIFLFCGNYLFAQNAVLTQLESIAQNNSASPAAFFNLGQYYFFNGKFAEAVTQFDKAIALDADDADFYFFQAVSYEGQGMIEQALNTYDKAITTDESTEYIIRRGYLRHKHKKYVGAANDFRAALEVYEDMADLKKALQDCEKNGAKPDKEIEPNTLTMKATAETPAIYLEKFLKQFERMSDAGELYRGMLHLFSNNLEKAIPVFEQFIKKDRDAESMFYQAIAYQVQGNQAKASNGYAMAIRKIEDEIVETSFEKLAGSPKAKLDLLRLKNIKIDYQFALQKLASKPENITSVDTDQTNAIKGEVRSAKSIYTFLVEKQEDNSYQLVVRDKMMRKVMLSSLKVEKKGEAIAVKIIWGDKKDDAGMSWAVRPQDFFIATYSPTSVEYKHEGERLQNAKNNKIDWTAMAEIRPTKITENEVLPYAVRSFMVGYLIKD